MAPTFNSHLNLQILETPVRPTLETPLVAVANRSSSIRKLRISAWQSGVRNQKNVSKHYIVYTTSWKLHNRTEHNCCMRLFHCIRAKFHHNLSQHCEAHRSMCAHSTWCNSEYCVHNCLYNIYICLTTYILHCLLSENTFRSDLCVSLQ